MGDTSWRQWGLPSRHFLLLSTFKLAKLWFGSGRFRCSESRRLWIWARRGVFPDYLIRLFFELGIYSTANTSFFSCRRKAISLECCIVRKNSPWEAMRVWCEPLGRWYSSVSSGLVRVGRLLSPLRFVFTKCSFCYLRWSDFNSNDFIWSDKRLSETIVPFSGRNWNRFDNQLLRIFLNRLYEGCLVSL